LSSFGGIFYLCKQKGHKANVCPDKKKNDESNQINENRIKIGFKESVMIEKKSDIKQYTAGRSLRMCTSSQMDTDQIKT